MNTVTMQVKASVNLPDTLVDIKAGVLEGSADGASRSFAAMLADEQGGPKPDRSQPVASRKSTDENTREPNTARSPKPTNADEGLESEPRASAEKQPSPKQVEDQADESNSAVASDGQLEAGAPGEQHLASTRPGGDFLLTGFAPQPLEQLEGAPVVEATGVLAAEPLDADAFGLAALRFTPVDMSMLGEEGATLNDAGITLVDDFYPDVDVTAELRSLLVPGQASAAVNGLAGTKLADLSVVQNGGLKNWVMANSVTGDSDVAAAGASLLPAEEGTLDLLKSTLQGGVGERTLLAKLMSAAAADAPRELSAADLPAADTAQTAPLASLKLAQSFAAMAGRPVSGSGLSTGVGVPVGQPQWGTAVAEKVLWMASQNLKEAEIHLDPPELGPLQVKVSVSHEQASVSFVAHHASVRDALDQGAGRLREMFAEEGLDLANMDVSDQSSHNADDDAEGEYAGSGAAGTDAEESAEAATVLETGLGLIDHYV